MANDEDVDGEAAASPPAKKRQKSVPPTPLLVTREEEEEDKASSQLLGAAAMAAAAAPKKTQHARSRVDDGCHRTDGQEEEDDEVEVLEADDIPGRYVAIGGKKESGNDNDDDVVAEGMKNHVWLPHNRQDCRDCPFQSVQDDTHTAEECKRLNAKFCNGCYCYVCDAPAKDCRGNWQEEHCLATDQGPCKTYWRRRRKSESGSHDRPPYRIEPAISGRGKCHGCNKTIKKGALRAGCIDQQTSYQDVKYGWWKGLCCWHVPKKVWHVLQDHRGPFPTPDDALNALQYFVEFDVGTNDKKQLIYDHLINEEFWAKDRSAATSPKKEKQRPKVQANNILKYFTPPKKTTASSPKSSPAKGAASVVQRRPKEQAFTPTKKTITSGLKLSPATGGTTSVAAEERKPPANVHIPPIPGRNGVQPDCLDGFTFSNTGQFPKFLGRDSLTKGNPKQGKKPLEDLIVWFGGTVLISPKAHFLIVGENPGETKRRDFKGKELSLDDLLAVIEGRKQLTRGS